MQSEPSAVSHKASTESSTPQAPNPPTQHGLRDNDAAVSLSSADDAETGTAAAEQVARDAAFAASLQGGLVEAASIPGRLSPKGTPSPPAGRNRITEYEKASTPPIRKREGPGFEVIKTNRSPSDKSSPIQELPNGSLFTVDMGRNDNANVSLRGLDACTSSPGTNRFDFRLSGVETVSSLGHWTARLAERIRSFLSWTRFYQHSLR